MKIFSVLLCILLAGCGSVSVTQHADGRVTMATRTLFKDISEASAQTEDMILTLGSSSSTEEASALTLVCVINPALPMCNTE